MNIAMIIKLENHEVEELVNVEFVFEEEKLEQNIVHTCVGGFIDKQSKEALDIDDTMEKLFEVLKTKKVIPERVTDFSYELPSCDMVKNIEGKETIPQNVVISYAE
ncbi:hypothetical protein [Bacillus sp. 2205SS5-2]|uniref:hypothetical protein n=1 Tax=Bacillus sp. 2205SS5-2 TaxID=3109031 RepID=UPI003005B5CA